jgi:hypothetical protein
MEADVAKKAPVKQVVIREGQAKDFKRMDLAAEKYGMTVAYFKALINSGKLTRYKLGTATLIDCNELEALIVRDVGNHGRQAAPVGSRGDN